MLQLGVADLAASKRFYVDRGFAVAKSYFRRYVEFDTGPIKLTLLKRRALAKVAGLSADGTGSHRLTVGSESGPFTDPDGFVWEAAGIEVPFNSRLDPTLGFASRESNAGS